MTKLYSNIKLLCKEHGITVRQLEDYAGLKRNTISSWGRSLPTCGKVQAVAQYFDVSFDFLLGNTDNRNSHKNTYSPAILKILNTAQKLDINDHTADIASTIMEMIYAK